MTKKQPEPYKRHDNTQVDFHIGQAGVRIMGSTGNISISGSYENVSAAVSELRNVLDYYLKVEG